MAEPVLPSKDQWNVIVALANRARNLAAAPDYDEQGIREKLWALADEVRDASRSDSNQRTRQDR